MSFFAMIINQNNEIFEIFIVTFLFFQQKINKIWKKNMEKFNSANKNGIEQVFQNNDFPEP